MDDPFEKVRIKPRLVLAVAKPLPRLQDERAECINCRRSFRIPTIQRTWRLVCGCCQ